MTDDQLTDLTGMTPEQIEAARTAGRLDTLLGITRHTPTGKQWTQNDVDLLFAERRYVEIEAARAAGKLDRLLAGTTTPEDAA